MRKSRKHRRRKYDGWYKKREYIHFDPAISQSKAKKIVSDPTKVKRHSFWPFLYFEQITNRYWQGKKDKVRPIMYAAHADAHIYAYYGMEISKNYEAKIKALKIDDCITAYRELGKSNINFAKEVFDYIEKQKNCTVLCFDVEKFFDTLDHEYLKRRWQNVIQKRKLPDDHFKVFRSLTKHAHIDFRKLNPILRKAKISTTRLYTAKRLCLPREFREVVRPSGIIETNPHCFGIPQGSPISGLLSNIYMLNFDKWLSKYVNKNGGLYRRYADDILIVCPSDASQQIKKYIKKFTRRNIKLRLNSDKTEEITFVRGRAQNRIRGNATIENPCVQYLGFEYDGNVIRIRPSSMARYYRKMRRGTLAAALQTVELEWDYYPRRRIYSGYSHFGIGNFVSYAYRASEIMYPKGKRSPIRRQLRNHIEKIEKSIDWAEKRTMK